MSYRNKDVASIVEADVDDRTRRNRLDFSRVHRIAHTTPCVPFRFLVGGRPGRSHGVNVFEYLVEEISNTGSSLVREVSQPAVIRDLAYRDDHVRFVVQLLQVHDNTFAKFP